jgi:hypothetical protein
MTGSKWRLTLTQRRSSKNYFILSLFPKKIRIVYLFLRAIRALRGLR